MKKILLTLVTTVFFIGYTVAQEQTFMTLKFAKEIGERVQLIIESEGAFNIEGVEESAESGYKGYTLTSKEIKIVGDIKYLSAPYMNIEEAGITNMPNIATFDIFGNPIKTIDLSKNINLKSLVIGATSLTELDITHCPLLEMLNINSSNIEAIDFSNNGMLTVILARNAGLKKLDLNGLESIDAIDISFNKIDKYDFTPVTTTLKQLSCVGNNIDVLDLGNLNLMVLNCNANNLKSLDLSGQTDLEELGCIDNEIESLDLSNCKKLFGLMTAGNKIFDKGMTTLVESLPTVLGTTGYFTVVDYAKENERNECSVKNVNIAKSKNWEVYDFQGDMTGESYGVPYEGMSEELLSIEDIKNTSFTVYSPLGSDIIYVSGTKKGDVITLRDMCGRALSRTSSDGNIALITVPSINNVYVVSVGSESAKITM